MRLSDTIQDRTLRNDDLSIEELAKENKAGILKWKLRLLVLFILTLGVLAFMIVSSVNYRKSFEIYDLLDTRLVMYENMLPEVVKIKQIYEIYNNETYNAAKRELQMTQSLRDMLFWNDTFMESSPFLEKPRVDIVTVQYEVTGDMSETAFFVTLLRTNTLIGDMTKHNVLVVYKDGVLNRLQGF